MSFGLLMSVTACVAIVAVYFVWGRRGTTKAAEQQPAQPPAPRHDA